MNIVNVKNISKSYQHFKLDHFSIQLKEGTLFGILGPNGSGKSTIVKILTGQLKPDEGEIEILSTNPTKNPIQTKEIIGIVPEQETPPSFLSVREYLEFVCKVRKISKSKIEYFLDLLELREDEHSLIKNLSRGNKQKVLLTQAFIHEPKVVFIDEPLINLDPLIQRKIKQFLVEYVERGNTIILSTHILSIAQEICTDICILRYGKNKYQGSMRDILSKHNSLEDYFISVIENSKNKLNHKKSNAKSHKKG